MRILDTKATAKRLKELFTANGYSAVKMARVLGVANDTVFKWLSATNMPKVDTLITFSEMFGVSVDDILVRK